jgi:hypothetical protein
LNDTISTLFIACFGCFAADRDSFGADVAVLGDFAVGSLAALLHYNRFERLALWSLGRFSG